jgi:hypothetical protein
MGERVEADESTKVIKEGKVRDENTNKKFSPRGKTYTFLKNVKVS